MLWCFISIQTLRRTLSIVVRNLFFIILYNVIKGRFCYIKEAQRILYNVFFDLPSNDDFFDLPILLKYSETLPIYTLYNIYYCTCFGIVLHVSTVLATLFVVEVRIISLKFFELYLYRTFVPILSKSTDNVASDVCCVVTKFKLKENNLKITIIQF